MNCKNCIKQGCSLAGKNHEMSFECKAYIGKTNADRILAMSVEELAEMMAHGNCGYCKIHDYCFSQKGVDCDEAWTDWLKAPVEDEK